MPNPTMSDERDRKRAFSGQKEEQNKRRRMRAKRRQVIRVGADHHVLLLDLTRFAAQLLNLVCSRKQDTAARRQPNMDDARNENKSR
jgi:hypothetical protein